MWDAIVLGLGPAGCAAARTLAASGLRVLAVERKRLPREKSCSGSLIRRSLTAVERIFGQPVPAHTTCTPVRTAGMVLVDGGGVEHPSDQEGLNVWRAPFDAWLASGAAEAGAVLAAGTGGTVLPGVPEAGWPTVRLRTGGGTRLERSRFVLDCRGVAEHKGGARPVVTYQTFHRGRCDLDPRYFYGFLQEYLSTYDAWLNVKDGLLVAGSAAGTPKEARLYHRRFLDYLRTHHGFAADEPLRQETWAMPAVLPGCPLDLGSGRLLRCGEAAGFLNPMGEGISSALESGAAAARAVATCLDDPATANEAYRKTTRVLRGYMMRQWDYVAGLSPRFARLRLG